MRALTVAALIVWSAAFAPAVWAQDPTQPPAPTLLAPAWGSSWADVPTFVWSDSGAADYFWFEIWRLDPRAPEEPLYAHRNLLSWWDVCNGGGTCSYRPVI